jgi:hypothetical protein
VLKTCIYFRLKAYRRRSWRAQSRGFGRSGGGCYWRHPQVHWGGALVAANGLLYLRQGQWHSCWSLPRPLAYEVISTPILAYIAMHFCFQVCCWVMNEWRVGILLPTTCCLTLELFLACGSDYLWKHLVKNVDHCLAVPWWILAAQAESRRDGGKVQLDSSTSPARHAGSCCAVVAGASLLVLVVLSGDLLSHLLFASASAVFGGLCSWREPLPPGRWCHGPEKTFSSVVYACAMLCLL